MTLAPNPSGEPTAVDEPTTLSEQPRINTPSKPLPAATLAVVMPI